MAADCKSAALTRYEGSNPSLGTSFFMKKLDLAGIAQLVERQPSKLNVAGSSPVSRSIPSDAIAIEDLLFEFPISMPT